MKLMKLPVIAVSAALGIVACSDDPVTAPIEGDLGAIENSSGIDGFYDLSSGSVIPGADLSSSSIIFPGSSDNVIPGSSNNLLPGSSNSGFPNSSNSGFGRSSNSGILGSSNSQFPASSSGVTPGGGDSGDDEGDNEDARTLNGTQILLKVAGTSATVENNNGCVEVADKAATITCPGAYYVTGEASDFQVVVNTPGTKDEGNTGIYLYNATLKSANSPILVKNADKAVIHLVKGTTNVLEDGNGSHAFTNVGGKPDTSKAVIYSKDDMNIKGAGKLTVNGKFKNGIHSTNDLKIKNGDITVVAKDDGIKGKGSLQISGGTLNITANEGDGLESDECEEDNRGAFKDTVSG